jgi:hypothetical protein
MDNLLVNHARFEVFVTFFNKKFKKMSDSDSECLFFIQTLAILAREACSLTERQNRRWAVRPINQNKNQSAFMNLIPEMKINDPEEFFSYTRMNLVQYNQLLSMVTPYIEGRQTISSIPAEVKLLVTLR